jgi:hypothetical protein
LSELDPVRIHSDLLRLRSAGAIREIFGANGHTFVVNATLSEAKISAFETQHRISLPNDYREFLLRIGNGGAGPYYGIFPLGKMDGTYDAKAWHENDGFVGVLSQPFSLTTDWNDLTGMPPDDLVDDEEGEYEKRIEEFEKQYWRASLMNGAIPICHEGCALRIWLVVTGEQGDSGVTDEPSLWEWSQFVLPTVLMRHFRDGTTNGWIAAFGLCLGD